MIWNKFLRWAKRVGPKAVAFLLPVVMAILFFTQNALATNYFDTNWNTSEHSVIDGVSFFIAIVPYIIQLLILIGIVMILVKAFGAGTDGISKLFKKK